MRRISTLRKRGAFVLQCAYRLVSFKSILVATSVVPACWVSRIMADEGNPPAPTKLSEVVVTAKKLPESVPDEVVTQHVEQAMHEDRYFYEAHVTVTTINGIVHLDGFVYDYSDLVRVLAAVRHTAGAKRVVNDLELIGYNGGNSCDLQ